MASRQGNALGQKPAAPGRIGTSPEGPGADEAGTVSKSLFVISGLGLASCVLLSMMMQHLLQVKAERKRSPLVTELEELFRSQLAGPIDTEQQERDGKHTLIVHIKVLGGLQKQRLGMSLGGLVWRRLLSGQEEAPEAVILAVADDVGGKVEEIPVPRPPMFGGPADSGGRTPPEHAPARPDPTPANGRSGG
jgi:hypothetical protein